MIFLEKLSNFFGKFMALIVLVIAALALFIPSSCSWIKTSWVNYLLLKTTVEVNILAMFLSIVKVLPMISVIAICMIVAAVVSANASKILTTGAIVFVVVILHNVLGYACGFGLGKLLKLDIPKTKALSVEIGMQNSGLATSLAATSFNNLAMATVPGAIFSVWHNISGAILANIYNHWGNKDDQEI